MIVHIATGLLWAALAVGKAREIVEERKRTSQIEDRLQQQIDTMQREAKELQRCCNVSS